VRSASIVGEFGGRRWAANGRQLKQTLVEHMGLRPENRVLEVGCGAGRQAFALADYLEPGGYTGFDVDERAIRACQSSLYLTKFQFFVADVENEVYRPNGSTKGSEYRFPLDENAFDFVFLASVFTHMLEEDCANYAREIARALRPGGTAAISTYLHTAPAESQAHKFAERLGTAYVEYPEVPTKLVSYGLDGFERWFEGAEISPLRGRWRRDGTEQTDEWQDWVVVQIPA
jgi:SAM-dependent methyltransferase